MNDRSGVLPAALPVLWVRFADVRPELHVAGNSEEPDDQVLVLPGGTNLPDSLWLDYRAGSLLVGHDEAPVVGILVRGDLRIGGALVNWEDDYGPFLQVHGDLTATGIATGGSQIHISGNIVTDELVGVYNHGSVTIDGDLTAALIATEHTVSATGHTTGLRYTGSGSTIYAVRDNVVATDNPYQPQGVFAPGLLRQGSVDLRLARRWLAEGRSIRRPTVVSAREEFRKRVGAKLAQPDRVKSLSLQHKDLTSLPEELFAFRNLRTLDLTHNELRTLPDQIGELTELRELRLRGNGLRALPESIGNLTQLRYLDLEANCLVGLPDSLARCTRLDTVILTNNPYSYVRESFGSWQNVELMWSLPECLFELPALERLVFDQTFVRSLPARPFASPTLGTVDVRRTLLLDHDPALHPQLVVDTDSSRARAVDYIRYWFDRDTLRLERFFDQRSGRYDFAEVTALLNLLLRIVIPTAAPYTSALETFQRQTGRVVDQIHSDHRDTTIQVNAQHDGYAGTLHVRRLFTAFIAALAPWQRTMPDNPLVPGLRTIFHEHT